jgi:hypothetical protein
VSALTFFLNFAVELQRFDLIVFMGGAFTGSVVFVVVVVVAAVVVVDVAKVEDESRDTISSLGSSAHPENNASRRYHIPLH